MDITMDIAWILQPENGKSLLMFTFGKAIYAQER